MKNSLTNPIRYGKVIAVQAVLLTAGIHFAFFLLFSVPQVRHEKTEKENTSVTLLRFEADSREAADFKNYVEKYAPSNFSNPRSPMGFGKFISRAEPHRPVLPPLGKYDMQFKSVASQVRYDIPDSAPVHNILPVRELKKIVPDDVRRINYPFAVSNSGRIIPLPLSVDELRMANEFPLNCGVYKLLNNKKSNMMPRLVLLQSSGRRALDRLSMRLLYSEMHRLLDCADGEIFTVHYRDHDGGGGL